MRAFSIGVICTLLWVSTGATQVPADSRPLGNAPTTLSELMITTQFRHIKLWFAGKLGNWKLAAYELDQIKSGLEETARLYSDRGVPDSSSKQIESIRNAIGARDAAAFAKAYSEFTNACNACHRAMNREFITIQVPVNSPFTDQLLVDQLAEGRALARQVCGTCHVVSEDSKEAPVSRLPAPSFPELARRPGFSDETVRQLLSSNHRRVGPDQAMPNPRLAEYQIEEIVAYFDSLKAKQAK